MERENPTLMSLVLYTRAAAPGPSGILAEGDLEVEEPDEERAEAVLRAHRIDREDSDEVPAR